MLTLVTMVGITTIAVVLFLMLKTDDGHDPKQAANPRSGTVQRSSTAATPPPRKFADRGEAGPFYPTPTAADTAKVIENARRFVTAWSRTGIPRPQWYTEVAKYCTTEFARQMNLVDPNTQIGRTEVPGAPHGTTVSYGYATTRVSMVGYTMVLRLRYVGDNWLVDDYNLDRSES